MILRSAADEAAVDHAFATNYYLSEEYDGECDECRGRGLSDAEHAKVRAKWQARWSQRTGNDVVS